jgi:hypothetical protein
LPLPVNVIALSVKALAFLVYELAKLLGHVEPPVFAMAS